ncbi:uncharacterized protein LOC127705982 [Mytilus californianus]|uniref:uncharacterized protein LOC127705982 n=1 Tax=Mytilus californianus TaxID=6549 RepID=UPI002245A939|nr:uncharacterized protein LOC127705982 [Mytilus californianus]
MEKYFKLVVFAIVLLFCVQTLVEAQQTSKKCPRSSSKVNKTDDTEPPSSGEKPENRLRLPRSALKHPSDYSETLKQFKCHCHKNIKDVPKIQPNYLDVCPAKTAIFKIGSWFGKCWVAWPFRKYHCPWTRCLNYNKCDYVNPYFGNSWCVHTQFKKLSIYVICWEGHWHFKKVSIKIPTCCGCRIYC